jgi:N-acetylmuramoyl-L-alanine amidase
MIGGRHARALSNLVAVGVSLAALALAGCASSASSTVQSTASATSSVSAPSAPNTAARTLSSASVTSSAPTSVVPRPPRHATEPRTARRPSAITGLLSGKTVVVDPGHNGGNVDAPTVINQLVPAGRGRMKPCNTTGTATTSGYAEASFNWDVALRLRRQLVNRGARVVLTRQNNSGIGPCVDERAAIGNAAHADAVIAIHADGAPPSGRGFHVIYPPDAGSTAPIYQSSLRLAHAVHDALLGSGLLPTSTYLGQNGYDQRDDLAGLNLSTQPAIFVELGNMANPSDASIQTDPGGRQRLAEALARGVTGFLSYAQP